VGIDFDDVGVPTGDIEVAAITCGQHYGLAHVLVGEAGLGQRPPASDEVRPIREARRE
jgi:hypothetical protein